MTNETVTSEQLGGASVHTTKSSIADGAYDNDVVALLQMRRLIDFLPASNTAGIPEIECYQSTDELDYSLDRLVPDNANKPYDIKELIRKTVDEGDFFEIQESFARNIVVGASAASKAGRSGSSAISRWCWQASLTAMRRARPRVSFASAIASTFRLSPSSMFRAFFRAQRKNMAA